MLINRREQKFRGKWRKKIAEKGKMARRIHAVLPFFVIYGKICINS